MPSNLQPPLIYKEGNDLDLDLQSHDLDLDLAEALCPDLQSRIFFMSLYTDDTERFIRYRQSQARSDYDQNHGVIQQSTARNYDLPWSAMNYHVS